MDSGGRRALKFLKLNRRVNGAGDRNVAGGIMHEHVFRRKTRDADPAGSQHAPDSFKNVALSGVVRANEGAHLRQRKSDASIERKFVMERLEIRIASVFAGKAVQWHFMRLLS